jgi:hypothetical protein
VADVERKKAYESVGKRSCVVRGIAVRGIAAPARASMNLRCEPCGTAVKWP